MPAISSAKSSRSTCASLRAILAARVASPSRGLPAPPQRLVAGRPGFYPAGRPCQGRASPASRVACRLHARQGLLLWPSKSLLGRLRSLSEMDGGSPPELPRAPDAEGEEVRGGSLARDSAGGSWIRSELRRLIEMTGNPPTKGQHAAWRGRLMQCVRKYSEYGGELGAYARHLQREADCIGTFLKYEGVDPTSNAVERALRPYVCRRKISFGQTSRHGEVDIARLLTLHETCRWNGRSTYGELKKALECHARGRTSSLFWIRKAGMKSGAMSPRNYAHNRLARPAEWYE